MFSILYKVNFAIENEDAAPANGLNFQVEQVIVPFEQNLLFLLEKNLPLSEIVLKINNLRV